eukprot:PhF_6_TR33570/c0_g1_i2/m.48983/K10134/EI24; etoposide-induced 2.4 mRNA
MPMLFLRSFLLGVIDSFNINRFFRLLISEPKTYIPFAKVLFLHCVILGTFPILSYVENVIPVPSAIGHHSASYGFAVWLVRTILFAFPMLLVSLVAGTNWCRKVYDSALPVSTRPSAGANQLFEDIIMIIISATVSLFIPLPVKIASALFRLPWLGTITTFIFGVLSHALYAFSYKLGTLRSNSRSLVNLLEERAAYLFGFGLIANVVTVVVLTCMPHPLGAFESIVAGFAMSNILLPVHVVVSCDVDPLSYVPPHPKIPILRLNYEVVSYGITFVKQQKMGSPKLSEGVSELSQ